MIGRLRSLFAPPSATPPVVAERDPGVLCPIAPPRIAPERCAPSSLPTWEELVALEPGLRYLLRRVEAVRDDPAARGFCRNAAWYGYRRDRGTGNHTKHRALGQLVGRRARRADPILATSAAYEVAFDHLYQRLPRCRECFCPPFGGHVNKEERR